MKNFTSPSPLFLQPNDVWRSYRGGSCLRSFRGQPPGVDNHFPEDWLASTVLARNGANARDAHEGLSMVRFDGQEVFFKDLQSTHPSFFPSSGEGWGVLVKLLDSADRLHIQAHPDDNFVKKNLGGGLGKTECWYILSTRSPEAVVYLGFQNPPSKAEWTRMVRQGDTEEMLKCFDPIPVKPGDCLMVPAGVPHAIGAGVFMMELQQPSDWVVRCEATVGDHTLPDTQRFMGIGLEACMEVFDFTAYPTGAWKQQPVLVQQGPDFEDREIIQDPHRRFFRLRRLEGSGSAEFSTRGPAILTMVEGGGLLKSCGHTLPVSKGKSILLPGHSDAFHYEPEKGDWIFLLAQPPL